MKSLEYVKKIREDLNQCFRHWNPATMNNDNDFYHNEWGTIQQDLEVLEIIRKKKVDVPLLERIIKGHSFDQAILDIYNLATNSQLTMEELLKIKKWLEENENER